MDSTPWLVGGGAEHSAETARLLAYVATGGAEGVAEPGDFKVTPLSAPGGGVRVASGGVLIRNSYSGGGQQTYVARNPSTATVNVPATGSAGGRADLIIVRVLDPQYEGTPPADPTAFDYARLEVVQGVPSNARSAADAGISYPAYAVARINLPASTGTVQASHITDLRGLAAPRRDSIEREWVGGIGPRTLITRDTTHGELFPLNGSQHQARIPLHATHMKITFEWLDVQYWPGANSYGLRWVRVGTAPNHIETHKFYFETPARADLHTANWKVKDTLAIPKSMRGQLVWFGARASLGTNAATDVVRIPENAATLLDVEFIEDVE